MTEKVKAIIATILIMLTLIALAILYIMFIEVVIFVIGLGVCMAYFVAFVYLTYQTMVEIF